MRLDGGAVGGWTEVRWAAALDVRGYGFSAPVAGALGGGAAGGWAVGGRGALDAWLTGCSGGREGALSGERSVLIVDRTVRGWSEGIDQVRLFSYHNGQPALLSERFAGLSRPT